MLSLKALSSSSALRKPQPCGQLQASETTTPGSRSSPPGPRERSPRPAGPAPSPTHEGSTPRPWALGWHLGEAPSTSEAHGTRISGFSFWGEGGSVGGREQRPDPHPKRSEAHPVDLRCWAGAAPRSCSHQGWGDGRDAPWARGWGGDRGNARDTTCKTGLDPTEGRGRRNQLTLKPWPFSQHGHPEGPPAPGGKQNAGADGSSKPSSSDPSWSEIQVWGHRPPVPRPCFRSPACTRPAILLQQQKSSLERK